ncbi:hypothetical protein [Algoriphagus limi]|uniref:Uncharacterized protein n=1 Tax=Algoriphagus limi TaxID=2975273 RepID=A0ABT2G3K5_9BACT|nr:hypothetical protein [Algoriphagus limi]MCS5489825.1 hypothetical protein [Algoriphagus limi]
MSRFLAIILFSLISFQSYAENPSSKTFLVLFKSQDLKQNHINLKSIESQFSFYDTKTYEGNSELALLIEIPSCDFDECFLGDFLIQISKDEAIQLQEIAFRLFDLTENKALLNSYLSFFEEETHKKEKKVSTAL